MICVLGYQDGFHAPGGMGNPGTDAYNCAHNLLKAHGKAYRLYESKYKANQGGRVGITLDTSWFTGENLESEEYRDVGERMMQFKVYVHNLFQDYSLRLLFT